jgi:hypothetical protein
MRRNGFPSPVYRSDQQRRLNPTVNCAVEAVRAGSEAANGFLRNTAARRWGGSVATAELRRDRNSCELRLGPERADEGGTVHDRHHEIRNHDVWAPSARAACSASSPFDAVITS